MRNTIMKITCGDDLILTSCQAGAKAAGAAVGWKWTRSLAIPSLSWKLELIYSFAGERRTEAG